MPHDASKMQTKGCQLRLPEGYNPLEIVSRTRKLAARRKKKPRPSRRHLLQFSLRTLLVLTTSVAMVCGSLHYLSSDTVQLFPYPNAVYRLPTGELVWVSEEDMYETVYHLRWQGKVLIGGAIVILLLAALSKVRHREGRRPGQSHNP